MANKSTNKNASKSTSKNVKNKNSTKTKRNEFDLETIAIGLIAISFFLIFSIYFKNDFIFTSFIRNFLVGLFGFSAFLLPIVFISIGSYIFLKQENIETSKYIIITLSLVLLSATFSAFSNNLFLNSTNGANFLTMAYTSAGFSNGGVVGASIFELSNKFVGRFLSIIIFLFTFFYLQIMFLNYSFNDIINFIRQTVEDSFLRDEQFNEEFAKKNKNSKDEYANLDIEQDIVFTKKTKKEPTKEIKQEKQEKEIQQEQDIFNDVKDEEFEGKREYKKLDDFNERNKQLNNSEFKISNKPTILNVRKRNPFAKKNKVRIFDFSGINNDTSNEIDRFRAMENEELLRRADDDADVFVHLKRAEKQDMNYQNTIQNDNQMYEYNYSNGDGYVYNEESINNQNYELLQQIEELKSELNKKNDSVKSLKEELDRQMFLFQDTQIEYLEQKKLEKSLLKIIDAQRETIEKLSVDIKVQEEANKVLSQTDINSNHDRQKLNDDTQALRQIIDEQRAIIENLSIEKENAIHNKEVYIDNTYDAKADIIDETEVVSDIDDIDVIDVIDVLDDLDDLDEDTLYVDEYVEHVEIIDENGYTNELDINKADENINVSITIEEELTEIDEEEHTKDDLKERLSTDDYINLALANIRNEAVSMANIDNGQNVRENDTPLETTHEINRTSNLVLNTPQKVTPIPSSHNIEKNITPIPNSNNVESIFDKKPEYAKPIFEEEKKEKYVYKYPTVDFLNERPVSPKEHSRTDLLNNSRKLETTLKSFGVEAKVIEATKGPSVTRYEVQPGLGVKVSKIANLADDLALNLAAKSIRIQAPIPGKAAVGIEVPNDTTETVYLREVLDDPNFKNFKSKLAFGIGKDISGKIVVSDLATMPHLLIAGATGSGKSVCVNTLITSIVYKSSPEEVKLLMIDPKVVELSVYNGIPHLLIPVVTDPKKASAALNWAVREMEKRYKLFSDKNVRDLKGYNAIMKEEGGMLEPQIVIIIDELSDLMMTAAKEVEAAIIRLAQMARAAGIHLIIATQRPSVDVITGIIKANIPSRLAFAVSSGVDSKTILDTTGAEKLLGKGDMLFSPMGSPEPIRIQGAFISDKEVETIVSFLKTDTDHEQMKEIIEEITASANSQTSLQASNDTVDEILEDVVEFIIREQKASTSLIQRKFRVGFNRAARIIDELEGFGVIGSDEGNKPRKVLMTLDEWNNKFRT